jgi:WD40 repeat protein
LSLAFSPDGTTLVTGAANGALQFWGISQAIPVE